MFVLRVGSSPPASKVSRSGVDSHPDRDRMKELYFQELVTDRDSYLGKEVRQRTEPDWSVGTIPNSPLASKPNVTRQAPNVLYMGGSLART